MKKDDFPYDFLDQFHLHPKGEDRTGDPEVRRQEGVLDEFLALLPENLDVIVQVRAGVRAAPGRFIPILSNFLEYVRSKGDVTEVKSGLAFLHPTSVMSFLKLFELCGKDYTLVDRFMNLGKHPRAVLILMYFEWLQTGREAVLSGEVDQYREIFGGEVKGFNPGEKAALLIGGMDKRIFDKVMVREMLNFVLDAMSTPMKAGYEGEGPFRAAQERFAVPFLVWGALLSEVAAGPVDFSVEDLEAVLEDTQEQHVQGSPDFLTDPTRMDDSTNYLRSDVFSQADYLKFRSFIHTAYIEKSDDEDEVDPEWGKFLLQDFPRQLQDPDYQFIFLRVKGELMGLIKWHKDGYIGSQYVDRRYAKRFAAGALLQKTPLKVLKSESVHYTVSVRNTAMERQIDRYGIGTGLCREGGSRELFSVALDLGGYRSKDRQIFTEEAIRAVAKGDKLSTDLAPEGCVSIFCIDSRLENDAAYIGILQSHFDKGQVLTRVFYDKVGGKPDRRRTYMVFEKKKT